MGARAGENEARLTGKTAPRGLAGRAGETYPSRPREATPSWTPGVPRNDPECSARMPETSDHPVTAPDVSAPIGKIAGGCDDVGASTPGTTEEKT